MERLYSRAQDIFSPDFFSPDLPPTGGVVVVAGAPRFEPGDHPTARLTFRTDPTPYPSSNRTAGVMNSCRSASRSGLSVTSRPNNARKMPVRRTIMRTCVHAKMGAVRLIAAEASMVEFMRGFSSLKKEAMVDDDVWIWAVVRIPLCLRSPS